MLARAIVVWVVLAVLAVVNAGLREAVWTPRFGERVGHVTSTVLLCAVIVLVAMLSVRWIGAGSRSSALLVGAAWTVLTLAFEFLAGHYLFGAPWERILADYNVFRGRIWVLVPVTTLFAPYLAFARAEV